MVVTFLPYPDIEKSLLSLDKRRLGKQRVEAFQIMKALNGETKGWRNHPATLMWKGYEDLLKIYYNKSLEIWEIKGGKNVVLKPVEISDHTKALENKPWWFGFGPLHDSHKAALIRKDSDYSNILSLDSKYLDLGYVWPHKHSLNTRFEDLFEKINPRQLLPKCSYVNTNGKRCPNQTKKNNYCGIHCR